MLKNRKNVMKVRNILIALMTIIMVLGIYIKVEAIDLSSGTVTPIYKPVWEKVSSTLNIDGDNIEDSTITIQLKGTASESQTIDSNVEIDYSSTVTTTLTADDIWVYIDGELDGDTDGDGILETGETPSITKVVNPTGELSGLTEATHTLTLSGFGETSRQTGKPFKEWSGNISIKILGRGEDSSTYDANVLTDVYGNQSMMESDEGQTDGTWIDITFEDTETDRNTNGTMFTDFIKPEFTYLYSTTNPDINTGDESVTVVFDVTDKYFASTTLSTDTAGSLITVIVDEDENANTPITKVLTKIKDVYYDATAGTTYVEPDATGTGTKVGERYQLVITGLDQEDGYTYSGYMTLSFDSGVITDKSGNTSDAKSITMGVNEPGGDSDDEIVVDVVDPIWEVQNAAGVDGQVDTTTDADGNVTKSMILIGKDKYFKQSTLTTADIKVKVGTTDDISIDANEDGVSDLAPELVETLSEPDFIKLDGSGNYVVTENEDEAIGVKYTYTVSGIKESDALFFSNRTYYNDGDDTTTGRLYREYSGDMSVIIEANTLEDETGNKSNLFTVDLGRVDTLKPDVVKVSAEKVINNTNVELSTYKIVFDIVDKYINSTSITTADNSKIHVYVDGETADSITKTITLVDNLTDTIDGVSKTIGYRYTLELSGFENPRTSIDYDRLYTDWSGDISIKIDANAATDAQGLGNDETILYGNEADTENKDAAEHVDFIKPDATYKYLEADVDTTNKEFTMVFDITDKFYDEDVSITDLEIIMSAEEETDTGEDHYYDLMDIPLIRDNLSLQMEEIKNQVVIDVENGTSIKEERVIGKRYTLVIKHLEQVQKVEGNYYLDYSGSITITVPENVMTDSSDNGNNAISITSGIDIPGGEIVDIAEVDVVDPLWERTSFTTDIHNKTATITLEGTDKYFYEIDDTTTTDDDSYGILTTAEIKLLVDGVEATGNISLDSGTKLYEQRIVETEYGDGDVDTGYTIATVQYGIRYVLTITDFDITKNQVKIQLIEGSLVDQSGNKSDVTEFLIYNTLKTATDTSGNWEDEATSGFLGNANIARQNIEQISFVTSLSAAPTIDGVKCWDVSAQRDNSILAWTTQTSAPYTVYIGSNDDIYGNINSSYLFSYIGYASTSTNTTTISELTELDTRNVTNMSYMFSNCGYSKMTSLQLGTNFDTSQVTNMTNMFANCGYTAMTTLTLGGDNFDTSNVTDMSSMFANCGYKAMATFNMGTKFNTSSVQDMTSMFQGFAQESTSFTTLHLGTTGVTFNTSAVTKMENMFNGCGQVGMTTFNLGSSFNTSLVQNMSGMFQNFAYKLETLDLGSNFITTAVTNMSNMFNGCGQTSMKTLKLGDNFNTSSVQNMSGMFQDFAKSSTTMTSLDLEDLFFITSATDMTNMFNGCGSTGMTTLDLGPAFTKIASTNTGFVTNCGKSGTVIFAPESIYSDRTHFKLNTDSTTTIQYTVGTINPVYRPEWAKVSSTLNINNSNIENSTISITFKGYANKTFTNDAHTGDYLSSITSSIAAGNDASNLLKVKIDGEDAESITQTVTEVSVTANEVQYTITLSGFKQTTGRQSAKNFLEWAGNIAVQPVKGTLIDSYGNKNMISIDDASGNWLDIEIRDASQNASTGYWIDDTSTADVEELEDNNTDASTNGIMFADYIKPEFTYEYYNVDVDTNANTVIDYTNNKLTVVFDVTDKYFQEAAITADDITVIVDGDEDANEQVSKTLNKKTLTLEQTAGNITYRVNGDIYYTVNGVSKKIGERYELVIDNLESEYGVGYSGIVTLAFPAGAVDGDGNLTDGIRDASGNLSNAKTITIGIDEPENPDHNGDPEGETDHTAGVVVDVVNPIWSYATSEIDRDNNEVNIYILGSDKHYKQNTLTEDKITVFVDNSSTTVDTDRDGTADTSVSTITKNLTEITDATELATLAEQVGLTQSIADNLTEASIGYKLTLSTFGSISGETKFVIAAGTIEDTSGNKNQDTTINVGKIDWVEDNEPLESTDENYPRYDAFKNNVVDFIPPIITYTYSTVMVDTDGDGTAETEMSANPDVDYDSKTVTVKFTVTDKYLLESDLIETDAGGNQIPKNMSIIVSGETVYVNDGDDATTDTREVTATMTSTDIANGKEYTLVVAGLQKYTGTANDGASYSGIMQLVFEADVIEDTSGNKNATKTVTLNTEIGSGIVDVVDPIVEIVDVNGLNLSGRNAANTITRTDGSENITIRLRVLDKYLSTATLQSEENVAATKIKVVTHDGKVINDASDVNSISSTFGITTTDAQQFVINKSIVRYNQGTATYPYIDYTVTLSGFLTKELTSGVVTNEGLMSLIIPEDIVVDTSGNGNIETEVYVGNSSYTGGDYTAYNNSIIDTTDPTWNYATSTITRNRAGETGTVTVKILGHDNYYFRKTLTKEVIKVYVNGTENTSIEKDLVEITDTTELTSLVTGAELTNELGTRTITDVIVGYTLTLSNFGTNDGIVKIMLPGGTIVDTSGNGNQDTEFLVGNVNWVETDVEVLEEDDENYPKYKAFRNSVVDFIKPIITYQYDATTNPVLDRTNDKVNIKFNVTDTNILEDNIGTEDIRVFVDVDDGNGNEEIEITSLLTANNAIELNQTGTVTNASGATIGYENTLTLSKLELDNLLTDEVFLRHSGRIRFVIAADQVEDTSGNKNIETSLIVDYSDGTNTGVEDDDYVIVDFIDPIFYQVGQYINWNDRYATITLRATDRFYDLDDSTNILENTDITLYEQNEAGQWIDITNDFYNADASLNKLTVTKVAVTNTEGYQYGYDYTIRLDDFEEEFVMKIKIAENVIVDTSDNFNQESEFVVTLDNKKPVWRYDSKDTSDFEENGTITFNVSGIDKFLDLDDTDGIISELEETDLTLILDGEDITEDVTIAVTETAIDDNYTVDEDDGEEITDTDGVRSISYQIVVTGLEEIGTYSLVFAKDTLIDEFSNKSAETTITFSKSAISSNTDNYTMVTYHVTPDNNMVHKSYVHELMSVGTSGTNGETSTYRPSTLGELYNNGENPLFAEPEGQSFAGWAQADEDGNVITDGTTYGLYDEIPNTVVHLKAVWQSATIIYVSSTGDSTNNTGLTTDSPVADIETAFSKLSTGTTGTNIIVVMDAVEWNSSTTISKPATITSLYEGIDYRLSGAELIISSNMQTTADIVFDNIKLYSSSTSVSDGTDYLANGTYTNMLIANYANVTIGRNVTTPDSHYTFGAIIGGNYKTESTTGTIGTHTVRVEAGRFNNIIAGSSLTTSTTTTKSITHEVVIGNMRDSAVSRNDKLTITGYVAIGENEQKCYPNGSTGVDNAYTKYYAYVTLYSGTFTGDKAYNTATGAEDIAIYSRSINGVVDGLIEFKMYGGDVNANIYAGARYSTKFADITANIMKFYGGKVVGNIFGQGVNDTFVGGSDITLQGIINITGNVFGGSNSTISGYGDGEGTTNITVNSTSATVTGNIYGGSNGTSNSGYLTGATNITVNSGTLTNIYGSGKNTGNTGNTNITIKGGNISGNIIGGAYNGQVGGIANITALGGTISGDIFGGNENTTQTQLDNDATAQGATIIIGTTDAAVATKPTINGIIYGGGAYDALGTVDIQLIKSQNTLNAVYGGANANSEIEEVNITLNGATVNSIYGGGKEAGTVEEVNIILQSGTVTSDVYGGGYATDVTTSNITLEGTANVTNIYGGATASATATGTVTTSNVILTSGTVTNVFGGGNSSDVGTSNVTLNGITIDEIHGGSKDAGTTTTTNVILTTGEVETVFGGGLDSTVGTSNVLHQNTATVGTIYGGNNSTSGDGGSVGTANITVTGTEVENIYGGNYLRGTTTTTVINIQEGTSQVTGNIYGGGYKSNIGADGSTGSTTINISGGTIDGDINGGSQQAVVYGNTNINIGKDAVGDTSVDVDNIVINGTIYGAGSSSLQTNRDTAKTTENYNYDYVSVIGNTVILMDNSIESPITFSGSIFGAGNGATYSNTTDNSKVHLKDFGSSTDSYELMSVERTGKLFIGNSFIELMGRQDINNEKTKASYTLNRLTNGLTVYNNTTLYTQRGFNMVGGFNSFVSISEVTGNGTKATTTNVDNRLYTFEGVNLIFSKQENPDTATATNWGEINGMTFFGMYAYNDSGNKEFDIYAPGLLDDTDYLNNVVAKYFACGTYIEGLHESSHSVSTDGFYTNVATYNTDGDAITAVTSQVIQPTPESATYYDWIIGAETVNYDVSLIGSISGNQSTAELLLDYNYLPGASYTLSRVSLNALDLGVELINPSDVSIISEDADDTFGLTIETDDIGWVNNAKTSIYTAKSATDTTSQDNGQYVGDTIYNSDTSSNPGTIKFKIYNSLNISQTKDLGFVNLTMTAKTTTSEGLSNTFIIVIAVNIQTVAEPQREDYIPSFTDTAYTELHYTTDSTIDLSYVLFKEMGNPYDSGDYRTISTTMQLPEKTKLTLKDYGQGEDPVVYYYHITSDTEFETETVDSVTRYIYKLSDFYEMDSTSVKYQDSSSYYHTEGYVLEKYSLSIDFIDAGITTNEILSQETYLELRDSSNAVKYNNGETEIKYNLYKKNAIVEETISNEGETYAVIDNIDVTFELTASITEQKTDSGERIRDTKYYDKVAGIAIEVLAYNVRVNSPDAQNMKITDLETSTEYPVDESGVIRIPLLEGVSSITKQYQFSIAQNNVPPGTCSVKVYFFASDDGQYYGDVETVSKEFYATFVSRLLGLVGLEATTDSRIISLETGKNLEGNTGIDMTASIGEATENTNIRIELYKRDATYDEDGNYTGTSYSLVNLSDYLDGTWETPETYGLTSGGTYEYMFWMPETEAEAAEEGSEEEETILLYLEHALTENVTTGEYKIVLKSYHDNVLVQTVRKTFVVTE